MPEEIIAILALAVFFGVAIGTALLGGGTWAVMGFSIAAWFTVTYTLLEHRRRIRRRR